MREWIESIVLGMIQGLTEFLPISSTGHLVLGRHLFGLSEAGLLLDTMLHVGTLLAVVLIYWRDVLFMIRHPLSRLTLLVIVGTVPTAIIGVAFKDFFEAISKTGVTIGYEYLVTGVILWFAEKVKHQGDKEIEDISYKDALVIGTLQGVAIMPAISRSGLTIAGSLYRGIRRDVAARYSFLLSLPAILGAVVLQAKDLLHPNAEMMVIGTGPLFAGIAASAVFGFIAVKWMISVLNRGSLKPFAYYVWALGIVILIAQWSGAW